MESSLFKDLFNSALSTDNEVKSNFINQMQKDYNYAELSKFMEFKDNLLIEAPAGSGKTTSLLLKVLYDELDHFQSDSFDINKPRVWVTTFLKAGIEDVKQRLGQLRSNYNLNTARAEIHISTMHSEYYRLLKSIMPTLTVISSQQQSNFIAKAFNLKQFGYTGQEYTELIQNYINTVSVYNTFTYDKHKLSEWQYAQIGTTEADFSKGYLEYQKLKQDARAVDFDDMQLLLYRYFYVTPNEDFINFVQDQYTAIYLDEFQDCSRLQYELLKVQAAKCKKLIAIGDSAQSIYSFRGSDSLIMRKDFVKDFNASTIQLTTNYRCPENILKPAIKLIRHNEESKDLIVNAAKQDGEVYCYSYSDTQEQTRDVVQLATKYVLSGKSAVILGRTNADLYQPSLLLESEQKVDYNYTGSRIALLNQHNLAYFELPLLLIGESVNPKSLSLLYRASGEHISSNHAQAIISKLLGSASTFMTADRELLTALKMPESVIKNIIELQKLKDNEEKLLYKLLDILSNKLSNSEGFMLLDSIIKIYNIKTIIGLNQILGVLTDKLARRKSSQGELLKLSTVHGFKGLEADVVFILNSTADRFPMIKDKTTDEDDHRFSLEGMIAEERRLFYIACTRPKEVLYIMTIDNNESPFIKEAGITAEHKNYLSEANSPFTDLLKVDIQI